MPDIQRLPPFAVTGIRGRYPAEPKALCSHHMEITISEVEPGTLILWIEDREAMDFWLHLVTEMRGET